VFSGGGAVFGSQQPDGEPNQEFREKNFHA
jgi:hypothetical protein